MGGAGRLRRRRYAARRGAAVPQRQSILSGVTTDIRVNRVSVSIRKAKAVPWKLQFLYYALVALVIALIAAFFGFSGVAGTAAGIAQLLFYIFLIIFVVVLIMNFVGRGRGPTV